MLTSVLEQAAALERVLGASRPGQEQFAALLDCCNRLSLAGESKRALELLTAAKPHFGESSTADELRFDCASVRALMDSQRFNEALELARRTLARPSDAVIPAHEHGTLRTYEAHCLVRLNRSQEALKKLEVFRSELLSRPDSELLSMCTNVIAAAHIRAGRWDLGREFALEAWVSARRLGSTLLSGFALGNVCIAERGKCRWHSAEEAGRAAVEQLTSAGAISAADHARRSLAIALLKLGRCSEVIEISQESLSKSRQRARETDVKYALELESVARLHLGQPEASLNSLLSVSHVDGLASESRPELLRLEYLGDVELEQGNFEAALKRYDEVLPHALALIPRGDVVAELRRRRAECYLMLGRAQESHDEAKAALELCLELGDRYEEAATYRTIALASAALGRHDEAKKHFVHGFAMYDDIETPYEWGKLWMA